LSSIDPASGSLLFRFPWETQFRCNIATPIVADGRVFISSDYDQGCALVEIVAAGAGLEAKEIYRNKQMNNHFSSCVLAGGKLYGFHKTFLSCLDFATGEKEWTTRGFGRGSVTIADGKLIIFGEQGKVALAEPNPERYQEISSFTPFEGRCWAAPVVSNGRLYLRGPSTIDCRDLRAVPTPSRDAPAGPGNQ
jgi:outer membrane protein assembly factor BamB